MLRADRLTFLLLHHLARLVCRLRGHRYVYGFYNAPEGARIAHRRCRRCQRLEQRAVGVRLSPARDLRPLFEELPGA